MRKFKTSKIDDEKFNQKFEEDLKEIKEKLHAEKPSDEFKQNLQAILEEELNKTSDKKERKFHFPIYAKKLAAVCACLIIFFSGCFTFADDIENVILKIFGNTDKIVEEAIANGNYKKIDMEYVEDNGVSVKVDYIVVEDNTLYIAFNILTEEEFDKIYFREIIIENNSGENILNKNVQIGDYKKASHRINSKNTINVYKIDSLNSIKIEKSLNINIKNISVIKSGKIQKVNKEWKFDVDM